MSIAIATLENALYRVMLAAGSNTSVILERSNAPRPELPYTGIRFISGGTEQFDWSEFNKATNDTEWFGFRELTYAVNCYGDNAMDEAERLNSRLAWPRHRELLRSITSASILSKGIVRDLSVLMSEAFEKRASFELFLLANIEDGSSKETSSDYFDKVAPVVWTNKP